MLKKNVIIIIFIVCACLLSAIIFFQPEEEIIVNIPKGSTADRIADILYADGLIFNKYVFVITSKALGVSNKLQSGVYKLSKRLTTVQILRIMKNGKSYNIRITVPEGYLTSQIADLLELKGVCSKTVFIDKVSKYKLDGYLFPETYFIAPGTPVDAVINIFIMQFVKVVKQNVIEKAAGNDDIEQIKKAEIIPGFNFNQILILASIIEKEAKLDSERKTISAVFHNRLKKGWLLESCATVRYALSKYKDNLAYKDLRVKSVYNTYKYHGLPPGPICNPGLKSILAAINPDISDAMFFYSEGDTGMHKFSKYYKDHLGGQKWNNKK
jgi:UPF0755 protein